jgi:Tfp pilus tip-associated adhesin PilY1
MKRLVWLTLATVFFLFSPVPLHADDTDLFVLQVPPDALILLDMSGSMNWDPAGNAASSPNRRIDIARSVLEDLLDDTDDGKIDSKDETSLNMRLGYMRFRNISAYDNDDGEPTTGNIKVLSVIGASYANIWNNISATTETAVGATPLASSMAEALVYFQRDVNPVDTAVACRQKFIILITDGSDTVACTGNGAEGQSDMNRRRMKTVLKAKELRDAGFSVFVVGFGGSMPENLQRTLNWTAKFGGTDNPLEINSGDPGAYAAGSFGDPCSVAATNTAADPATYPLSGYAFLAQDASQLSKALKAIIKYIQEKSFSFTAPTIPSVRLIDKDVVYISSFIPNETPYWRGNLKAYNLNSDGTLPVDNNGQPLNSNLVWDVFENLKATAPDSRNIYTHLNSALTGFTYGTLSNADLDVSLDTDRANLINHIRGIDAFDTNENGNTTETREWKLGDIFHSNAVIVGEPSRFYEEEGFSGTGGFYQTNKNRRKVILVGANDGMLHAFDAATGEERWAFIPGSLLKSLKNVSSAHTYYVDSSPKVADVWFYSSSGDTTKGADEWKTVLICGLRKGGKAYFALDITDTLNPKYLWEFPNPTDSSTLAKVGESWSEPAIGKVKVEKGSTLVERWVAFVGGGFDYADNTGRAFFVVDIKTGEILWQFAYESGVGEKNYMIHSFPSPPAAVDINSDGFIDKVYIGDVGGQMWVFDVSFDQASAKGESRWSGKRLFQAPATHPEKHPIYYQPAVALDQYRTPWVFFGTGDRENPKDTSNPSERFYAVRDDGKGAYPRAENDLSDVTSLNTYTADPATYGWFIKLEKTGQHMEKVLAKPVVFNRLVYFTTYTYKGENPCEVAGFARLYTMEYLSGGGAVDFSDQSYADGTTSSRSVDIGVGVPSAPVISVNLKGQASVIIGTTSGQVFSKKVFSPETMKDLLYWRKVTP